MHSALIQFAPSADMGGYVRVDDGTLSPPILHMAPGTPIPADATVLMAGDAPWTWGAFAQAFPALAAHCLPNEWAGENTATDITPSAFPLTAPAPSDTVSA